MQTIPSWLCAIGAAAVVGCAHEVTSEERLERETQNTAVKAAITPNDLAKVNCQDAPAGIAKARVENRPEADRLQSYLELYESLKKRTETFDEAFTRNPDFAYQEGNQSFVEAKDLCVQQTADVRVEFERFLRDLVKVPTVQEFRGGNTVSAPRLEFSLLRQAIEVLAPDDKEQLLARVGTAEKSVQAKSEEPRKKR